MGKISNTMNHYFSDNKRFADLFNAVWFHGHPVVDAERLTETSEVYHEVEIANSLTEESPGRGERIRDVCKRLDTGAELRILALENQTFVDYSMPIRCMQYDVADYRKQIDGLRRKNEREKKWKSASERFCGLRKDDRLVPVYTLCLYHGVEKWDGPRSLRDMMRFDDKEDSFAEKFGDYPLHLYCLNEEQDFHTFQTEVGLLFRALQCRKDRMSLRKLLAEVPEYRRVDADTLEAMAVLLELPSIWKHRKDFMIKNENNREEYNMCQAVREWAEEERKIGREEEKNIVVRNLILRGMPDQDILQIVECDVKFINNVRSTI